MSLLLLCRIHKIICLILHSKHFINFELFRITIVYALHNSFKNSFPINNLASNQKVLSSSSTILICFFAIAECGLHDHVEPGANFLLTECLWLNQFSHCFKQIFFYGICMFKMVYQSNVNHLFHSLCDQLRQFFFCFL